MAHAVSRADVKNPGRGAIAFVHNDVGAALHGIVPADVEDKKTAIVVLNPDDELGLLVSAHTD